MKRLLPGLILACALATASAAAPPNLVFLLADDLRWDALGCAGNPIAHTPHLDRLAREGTRFRNAFVTTSICSVSRASLLCGQPERRHGIVGFDQPFTPEQWARCYPALLRRAGYRTGFIGKWGVGHKPAQVAAMAPEFDFWRGLPGQGGLFFDPKDPTRTHATARFGEQALEFLRGCDAAQPFCLSVSFTAPHARDGQPREFAPDPRDEGLFADASVPVPATATDALFQLLPPAVRKSEGRIRWQRRFATAEMFQRTAKDYLRLVSGIDREVGRIVEELNTRGFGDNTVIVFTSDNGFFFGERGMADKWLMYEESIRVPCLVFDPRAPLDARGHTVDALALNTDLAPTLLAFAGVPAPEEMEGRSLLPLLQGARPADWRTEFFYEHHTLPEKIPPSEGVRTERWSYLRWIAEEPAIEELYDMADDPGQERNLAADPAHAETLAGLRARWAAWRAKQP